MGKLITIGAERDVRVPPGLNELLAKVGGVNPYGEPLYRLVWGWSRRCWMGGKWASGFVGWRYWHKYDPPDRFHMELWHPPSHYGERAEWKKDTTAYVNGVAYETLGTYPSRGDYEHLLTIEDENDGFLMPTHDFLLHVVQVHKTSLATTAGEKAAYINQKRDSERDAHKKRRAERLRDVGDRFVTNAMRGRTVRELKEEMAAFAPANHPRPSTEAFRRAG